MVNGLEGEVARWSAYRNALRRPDRELFDIIPYSWRLEMDWHCLASLRLTFYLYVPNSKVDDAVKIIDSKGLRTEIYGLRGHVVADGKIQINDIWH